MRFSNELVHQTKPLSSSLSWPGSIGRGVEVLGSKKPKKRRSLWKIDVDYTKGAVNGRRGVVVEVRSVRTGQMLRESRISGTKADSYRLAQSMIDEMIKRLS